MTLRSALSVGALAALAAACGSSRPIPPLPSLPDNGARSALWERRLGGTDIPLAVIPVVAAGDLYAA